MLRSSRRRLEPIEADADHVRAEVGSTPITRLPEDDSWGGEALDVVDVVELSWGLASRTVRVLRRSDAARVFVTARVRYRGRSRLIIDTVAEDDAGRELVTTESEFLPLPSPIAFRIPPTG